MFVRLTRKGNYDDPRMAAVLVNSEHVIDVFPSWNAEGALEGTYIYLTRDSFSVTEKFDKVCEMFGWRRSGEVY